MEAELHQPPHTKNTAKLRKERAPRHLGGTTGRESATGDGDDRTKTPEHRRRRGGRVHRNPRRVKPMRASTGGWDRRIDAVEHTEREERRRLVASTITETAGFRRNRPAKAAAAEKEKAREREAR